MGDTVFGHPDWVILGVPTVEGAIQVGVMVIASTELNHAELEEELIQEEFLFGQARFFEPARVHKIELRASLRGYTLVFGKDYGEAVRKLFESWEPKAREQTPLPPPMRELE